MASVPIPHQFAVGEAVTSANINTYYNGISFLESPPVARVYATTTQSINTSTITAINFGGTLVDTYGGHSNTTNNSRYTFQVAGIYLLVGTVSWQANGTGIRASQFQINGVGLNGGQTTLAGIAGSNVEVPATSVVVAVNLNDYVELYATQTSGGSLSTQASGGDASSMSITWLHL